MPRNPPKEYTMPDGKIVTAASISAMTGITIDTLWPRLKKYPGRWDVICHKGNLTRSILRGYGIVSAAAERYEYKDGRMLPIAEIAKILGFPYGKTRNRLETYPGRWDIIEYQGRLNKDTLKEFGINNGEKTQASSDWRGLKGNTVEEKARQLTALSKIKVGPCDNISGHDRECYDCADWMQRS